ncbi:MAG: translation initiation factor IF-2 [Clostridia bacterium]|nr:translation initiation factor IF-2 [Clostridia bacterium]
MSKIRVYQLAKDLGTNSKDLLKKIKELHIDVKNHMSTLEEMEVKMVKNSIENQNNKTKAGIKKDGTKNSKKKDDAHSKKHMSGKKDNKNKKPDKKEASASTAKKTKKPIVIGENISIKNFSEKVGISVSEIIKKLMALGVMATINQDIDYDTAAIIADDFGIKLELKKEETYEDKLEEIDAEDDPKKMQPRPPIVTVMGHVDHGKTSLLDSIRKTSVTQGEAGGITQHIGAYQVEINSKKITFLDTPGHEAFTSMRARGASVTDIAILVVAADDGVMPQTVEAINHAKAADVPIIIAINKMDKPNVNPDRIKQQLTEYGLVPEEWGGDTICVPVSALTKKGIDNLLEMVILVAEMQELKANPDRFAKGIIVEAEIDKGRGPVATVIIQNGTLKIGDSIVAGTAHGKVRALIDDKGKRTQKAGPSTPVEVLGLSEVPEAGDMLYSLEDDKLTRQIADERKGKIKEKQLQAGQNLSLDELFSQIKEGEIKELNLIIKADVQGSVEAVKQALERLSDDKVKIKTIHQGVGAITETDIMLATASNAIVIGFNVRPDIKARELAEKESIDIRLYRVIYDAIEDVQAAMKGMLEPKLQEKILGHAQVRATFKVPGAGTIAGSYVTDGKVSRHSTARLIRDGVVVFEGNISSLKRFKDDAREVVSGYECGIGLENFNDIKENDVIESYIIEKIKE